MTKHPCRNIHFLPSKFRPRSNRCKSRPQVYLYIGSPHAPQSRFERDLVAFHCFRAQPRELLPYASPKPGDREGPPAGICSSGSVRGYGAIRIPTATDPAHFVFVAANCILKPLDRPRVPTMNLIRYPSLKYLLSAVVVDLSKATTCREFAAALNGSLCS